MHERENSPSGEAEPRRTGRAHRPGVVPDSTPGIEHSAQPLAEQPPDLAAPEHLAAFLSSERGDDTSWEDVAGWLASPVAFLPLLGWDGQFILRVARMDPQARRAYLDQLPGELLDDPQAHAEWRHLTEQYREAARKLVAFWRVRHDR